MGWSILENQSGNWTLEPGILLTIQYYNSASVAKKITSLTCQIAQGETCSLHGNQKSDGTSLYNVTYDPNGVSASLYYNDTKLKDYSITKSVALASSGTSSTDQGYFTDIGGDTSYNVTFSGLSVEVASGSTVTFVVKKTSTNTSALTVRRAANQEISGTISPVVSNFSIDYDFSVSPTTLLYNKDTNVTAKFSNLVVKSGSTKLAEGTDYTVTYSFHGSSTSNPIKFTHSTTSPSTSPSGEMFEVLIKGINTYAGVSETFSESVQFKCKLNPPTVNSISTSSPVLFGETTVVNLSISKASNTPGGTTLNNSGVVISKTGSGSNASTLRGTTLTVRSKTTVSSNGPYETKDNYERSNSATNKTVTVSCKLRPPSLNLSTSTSTGGYTVDLPLVLSLSKNSTSPEGITVNNTLEKSTDGTSWSILNKGNDGFYHTSAASGVRFRASTSCDNYVTSSYTEVTPKIYLEPRNMESNGFTCTFGFPRDNHIVYDGEKVTLSWSSFSANKNLGRFNWYQVECQELSSGTWTTISGGANNPETKKENVTAMTVSSNLQGKTLRLILKCMYSPDNGASTFHDDRSAAFSSEEFTVVAKPTVTLLYPTSSWNSANPRSRLIFKVTGYGGVSDVSVKTTISTTSSTETMTYKASSSPTYFTSVSHTEPPYTSGTVLDFTLPSGKSWTSGATAVITCTDAQGATSDSVTTPPYTYHNLPYVKRDNKIYAEVANSLIDSAYRIAQDYSGVITQETSTAWSQEVMSLLTAAYRTKVARDAKVENDLFRGNLINALRTLYNSVLSGVSVAPSSVVKDLSKLNTDDLNDILIDANDPFEFGIENDKYIPTGNYFNYIIYILKNML